MSCDRRTYRLDDLSRVESVKSRVEPRDTKGLGKERWVRGCGVGGDISVPIEWIPFPIILNLLISRSSLLSWHHRVEPISRKTALELLWYYWAIKIKATTIDRSLFKNLFPTAVPIIQVHPSIVVLCQHLHHLHLVQYNRPISKYKYITIVKMMKSAAILALLSASASAFAPSSTQQQSLVTLNAAERSASLPFMNRPALVSYILSLS